MRLVLIFTLLTFNCGAADLVRAQSAAATVQLQDRDFVVNVVDDGAQGSSYVPLDNWIYLAMTRLHALGYVDTAFLGLRPWTRQSIAHMLEQSAEQIQTDPHSDQALSIYFAILREVQPGVEHPAGWKSPLFGLESTYAEMRDISGLPLRDSFHLGQSLVNDYGRPYEQGLNEYSGFSMRAQAGRLSLYVREEYQHAPSAAGYSDSLAQFLSESLDQVPFSPDQRQDTIPAGPIAAAYDSRVVEANLSYQLAGHEISFGKSDHWLGPAEGASMLWGNDAENIYAFEINRVEPLRIPGLSRLTGPFRYDFFVGSLKGHTYPNDPWVHMEKISFKPTKNLEFGFSRMDIWGGKRHAPITVHTFLHSFFSFQNVSLAEKDSTNDPGYRLGTFDVTYRVPHLRDWVTIYTDSVAHDSMNPSSNPNRSGWRPGFYLARFPGLEQLDFRAEASYTDTASWTIQSGQYTYWEGVQRQGPTNKGNLVGDWVGRQGKGGQAWLTWHLTPQQDIQFQYRNAKAATGFIPGGTTQNAFAIEVRKRFQKDVEVLGWAQFERWKAPIYQPGSEQDNTVSVRVTWFPGDAR
jgi:hypothetical protein